MGFVPDDKFSQFEKNSYIFVFCFPFTEECCESTSAASGHANIVNTFLFVFLLFFFCNKKDKKGLLLYDLKASCMKPGRLHSPLSLTIYFFCGKDSPQMRQCNLPLLQNSW